MKRLLLLAIAASRLGAQPSSPAWTVSPGPTLYIGSESNTQTQFNGVAGIIRLSGGEIVVANGLSQELRVFSPSGSYVRTLSHDSPARTMRSLDRIWRGPGDTIYAAEILPAESSVWVFTLTGFVAKTQIGAANAGGIFPLDRFPDGRFVISAPGRGSGRLGAAGTFIDSMPVGVLSLRQLASPSWIGMLRNESVYLPGRAGGRGRVTAKMPYPYGRSTSVAVSGDRVWVGDSETGTIAQYSSTGRGLTVFSSPMPPRQLDTAAIRRRRSSILSDAMNWNNSESFYPLPGARSAPRFRSFTPGANGEMWIEVFHEDPGSARSFVVVDRGGAPIGRVALPQRFRLLEVGTSDVLGVVTDQDGLEHIARFTLTRR